MYGVYLVGSCIERQDFRDVDVRAIVEDGEFDRLFPGHKDGCLMQLNPLWSLMCSSISLYLSQHSGLPVDFQIQRQTQANAEENGRPRSALGMYIIRRPDGEMIDAAEPVK